MVMPDLRRVRIWVYEYLQEHELRQKQESKKIFK
jgi:hypothetical protein